MEGIGAGWLRELARGEREAREVEAVAAAKAGQGGGEGGYGHFMAGEVASEGPQPLLGGASSELVETL